MKSRITSSKKLCNYALRSLRKKFPGLIIEINPVIGGTHEVNVFNTPARQVRKVKDAILDLDGQNCIGTRFCLIPMVRNKAVTKKYYSDKL